MLCDWGAAGTIAEGDGDWAWVSVGLVLGPGRPCTFGSLPAASAVFTTAPKLFLPHTRKRKEGRKGREGGREGRTEKERK